MFLPLGPFPTSLVVPLDGASRDELRLITSQLSVFSKSVSLAFCACAPLAARKLSLMSELELIGGNGPFPPVLPAPPGLVFGGRGGREGEKVMSVAAVASDVRGGNAGGFLGGTGGIAGEDCGSGVAASDAGTETGCAVPLNGFLDLRRAAALSAVSERVSS